MLNIARNAAIDVTRSRTYRNNLKNREPDNILDTGVAGTMDVQVDYIGMSKLIDQLKTEHQVLIILSYLKG